MESLTCESLDKVARMAEEMEEKIEILEFQRDDLCRMVEQFILENEDLKERLTQEEDSRASYTRLQIAVSILFFVYGLLYGSFFCRA
jgi:DNA-directed RNA polymerase specialized sigma54-like protein